MDKMEFLLQKGTSEKCQEKTEPEETESMVVNNDNKTARRGENERESSDLFIFLEPKTKHMSFSFFKMKSLQHQKILKIIVGKRFWVTL